MFRIAGLGKGFEEPLHVCSMEGAGLMPFTALGLGFRV